VPLPQSLEKKFIEEKELEAQRKSSHPSKGSGRWIAIAIVVIVIIAMAAATTEINQNTARTSYTSTTSFSNTVWSDKEFVLNGTWSYIQATLNPLSKTNYVANGHIEVVRGCLTIGGQIAKCPSIALFVVNETGLQQLLSTSAPPRRTYGMAMIPDEQNFTLENLDHNGIYFFAFENQEPSFGPNPVVSITLTESWTETVTQIISIAMAKELDIVPGANSRPEA
jgi:hypothetical protein